MRGRADAMALEFCRTWLMYARNVGVFDGRERRRRKEGERRRGKRGGRRRKRGGRRGRVGVREEDKRRREEEVQNEQVVLETPA